jgi:glutamine phosphoribosylpyrophosphate amidotransferase
MNFTKHARERSCQRGITHDEIALILQYGKNRIKSGGAFEIGIKNKEKNELIVKLKKIINKVEKIQNKRVLIIDDSIITVYHNIH